MIELEVPRGEVNSCIENLKQESTWQPHVNTLQSENNLNTKFSPM